jgi:AcrR family transcriptional regulator
MARRSDHSRAELEALILAEAHRQMEEVGFARFSAREVAKRIGYSIGTLYNVHGSLDRLILAINARTIGLWVGEIEQALSDAQDDRIGALVRSYFAFATRHYNAWAAIYDHRSPAGDAVPGWYDAALGRLTGLVVDEVASALPATRRDEARSLAFSLLAAVHGHCVFALDGTFDRLGADAPLDMALRLVRDAIAGRG